MPLDPMTSYEQAEIEADERFYEERDDREAGDDDGQEYADPRDEQDERFDALMAFVLGDRPE